MTDKKWEHDELVDDLAIAKGGIPFVNICLGSSWVHNNRKTPRADLLIIRPSYRRFLISVYEIKVTRSDFLSDIRSEKWKSYLEHCDRFYFATLEGIISFDEIPSKAGLVTRGKKGWYTRKAAPKMNNNIDVATLKSLIFAKQRRSKREKRLDDIQDMAEHWRRKDYFGRLKAARVLGAKFGLMHEAAMNIGGIDQAIELLKNEFNKRLGHYGKEKPHREKNPPRD